MSTLEPIYSVIATAPGLGQVESPGLAPQSLGQRRDEVFRRAPWGCYHSYRLDNGITIHFLHQNGSSGVDYRILLPVGARNDPPGLEGLAHFAEHCALRCSSSYSSASDVEAANKAAGLTDTNGQTSLHTTVFSGRIDERRPALALVRLCEHLFQQTIHEGEFHLEHKAVIRERPYNLSCTEQQILYRTALRAIYPGIFSDQFSVLGSHESLAKVTPYDLKTFFKKYYDPELMHIVLAGNIGRDFESAIEGSFGKIPGRKPRSQQLLPIDPLNGFWQAPSYQPVHTALLPVQGIRFTIAFPGINLNNEQRGALEVLCAELGNGKEGWLWKSARRDLGLVYHGTAYADNLPGASTLEISSATDNTQDLIQFLRVLHEKVLAMTDDRYYPHNDKAAVVQNIPQFALGHAELLVRSLPHCGEVLLGDTVADRILATTQEQIVQAARQVFRSAVVVAAGRDITDADEGRITDCLQDLGWA